MKPFSMLSKLVGCEGLDLPSAGPQVHCCKHSLRRNFALRIATGNSHPDPLASRIRTNPYTKIKRPPMRPSYFGGL